MQRIELELNHNNLFCPVTGQRILSDGEPFEPSPAMLFCFIEDIEDFEFATDEIRNLS